MGTLKYCFRVSRGLTYKGTKSSCFQHVVDNKGNVHSCYAEVHLKREFVLERIAAQTGWVPWKQLKFKLLHEIHFS